MGMTTRTTSEAGLKPTRCHPAGSLGDPKDLGAGKLRPPRSLPLARLALGMTSRGKNLTQPVPMALLTAVVLFNGCAGAPPAAHPPAPAAAPAVAPPPAAIAPSPPLPPSAPAIPLSRLICTVREARRVAFADLGVPAGSRPVDVALGKDRVWVLFTPALLVGLPRAAEQREPVAVAEYGAVEEVEMIPGPRPDAWRSISADPWDGTLWLAGPSGLWRRRPGRRPEPVAVAGAKGGFHGVVAWRGAVWAAPDCSDRAVWKLDSRGKVLATALPQPGGTACASAGLERDWSGALLALLPGAGGGGAVFRLAFDGSWQPAGDAVAVPVPPADGGPLVTWFFWGPEAISLAGAPGDRPDDTLLYRRVDGRVTAFHEDCGPGNSLLRVAGDARGWAALTREWLLVGEHQRPQPGSH